MLFSEYRNTVACKLISTFEQEQQTFDLRHFLKISLYFECFLIDADISSNI